MERPPTPEGHAEPEYHLSERERVAADILRASDRFLARGAIARIDDLRKDARFSTLPVEIRDTLLSIRRDVSIGKNTIYDALESYVGGDDFDHFADNTIGDTE